MNNINKELKHAMESGGIVTLGKSECNRYEMEIEERHGLKAAHISD